MLKEKLTLRPYQERGVAWLTDRHPHKLLADDMGLGKTPQCIEAMNRLGSKTAVVVCPATVKIMWARRIAQWARTLGQVFIVRSGKDTLPAYASVIVLNYDLLIRPSIAKQLGARGQRDGFDVVIFDESRALKEMSAKRTKAALGRKAFTHHARRIWLLDGTPVPNRPVELFPVLSTLAPEVIAPHNSYQQFGLYFCRGKRNIFGWDMSGHSNIDELSKRLLESGFFLRRTKEEVLDDLPAKVESYIDLDVAVPSDVSDTHIATVRRDLAIAKIPEAVSFIRSTVDKAGKLVVFAHHREVIETLRDELSDEGAVIVYGGMNSDQKQHSIDSFITNPAVKVLIGQTVAGGSGVDGLQGVCNHVVFVEPDWSPGVMDQAIDRCRRIGQKQDTVFVYYLSVPDSLDIDMDRQLERKRKVINQLMPAGQKERKTMAMTIEGALSELIGLNKQMVDLMGKFTAGIVAAEPAEAKPKTTRAKKETAPDPEPDAPTPAAATSVASKDDVAKAIEKYLHGTVGEARQDRIGYLKNEVLMPNFGVNASKDLKSEQYDDFVALMKAEQKKLETQAEEV